MHGFLGQNIKELSMGEASIFTGVWMKLRVRGLALARESFGSVYTTDFDNEEGGSDSYRR